MKKFILPLLVSLAFLTGCGGLTETVVPPLETIESAVVIAIKDKDEVAVIKEFDLKVDTSVLLAMRNRFDIELGEDGRISSINGHAQAEDGSTKWIFNVNGEYHDIMSKKYILQDGDVVYWELIDLNLEE